MHRCRSNWLARQKRMLLRKKLTPVQYRHRVHNKPVVHNIVSELDDRDVSDSGEDSDLCHNTVDSHNSVSKEDDNHPKNSE